jgi:hypothetical protein
MIISCFVSVIRWPISVVTLGFNEAITSGVYPCARRRSAKLSKMAALLRVNMRKPSSHHISSSTSSQIAATKYGCFYAATYAPLIRRERWTTCSVRLVGNPSGLLILTDRWNAPLVRTDTAIGDDDALDCRRPLGSFPALIPFKCLDFFYGLLGCRRRSDATQPLNAH